MSSPRVFVTPDLLRRLEAMVIDGRVSRLKAGGLPDRFEVGRFGPVTAIRVNWGGPPSGVFGLNKEGLGLLREVMDFIGEVEIAPEIYLKPTDLSPEVIQLLELSGFKLREMSQVVMAGPPEVEQGLMCPGVSVDWASGNNLEEFVKTMAGGLDWDSQWREAAMDGVRRRLCMPGVYGFIGRVDGVAAGTALLTVKDAVGVLEEGAVLPEYRGRGCQLALLATRFGLARQLGCRLMMGVADFQSINFRNQQRFGLNVAYFMATFAKESQKALPVQPKRMSEYCTKRFTMAPKLEKLKS